MLKARELGWIEVGVDVVIGGAGIEDEVEAAGVLAHLVGVARDDDPRRAEGKPGATG
jgi:hypothetical protein